MAYSRIGWKVGSINSKNYLKLYSFVADFSNFKENRNDTYLTLSLKIKKIQINFWDQIIL